MAQNTTYTTNAANNIFEDVEGIIQTVTPHNTPFLNSIGKTKVTNTYHEWLEDELTTGQANAAVEGADATFAEKTQPSRLANYTQIFQDTFQISGTFEATDKIGRKSEASRLMQKTMKEIATDMEYALINNAAAVAGDGLTARQAKGLEGFVSTNDLSYASYANTNDFSEEKLMDMAIAVYTNSDADTHKLLVPPIQAKVISNWDQNNRITVNQNADSKKLTMVVMTLITPFGDIQLQIDRFIASDVNASVNYDRIYMYAPEKFKLGTLTGRNLKTTELARTGDSRKYQTLGEYTLVCHSEKAAAKCKKVSRA